MARKDYSSNVATAQRLIARYGRDITLHLPSTTLVDDNDITLGRSSDGAASQPTRGAFVYPSGFISLGMSVDHQTLVASTKCIILVAPIAGVAVHDCLRVSDDEQSYTIDGVERLRPGDTDLLYYLRVAH